MPIRPAPRQLVMSQLGKFEFASRANDVHIQLLSCLAAENCLDGLSLYGDLQPTKDKHDLAIARQLRTVIDGAVHVLKLQVEATKRAKNPSAWKSFRAVLGHPERVGFQAGISPVLYWLYAQHPCRRRLRRNLPAKAAAFGRPGSIAGWLSIAGG